MVLKIRSRRNKLQTAFQGTKTEQIHHGQHTTLALYYHHIIDLLVTTVRVSNK